MAQPTASSVKATLELAGYQVMHYPSGHGKFFYTIEPFKTGRIVLIFSRSSLSEMRLLACNDQVWDEITAGRKPIDVIEQIKDWELRYRDELEYFAGLLGAS